MASTFSLIVASIERSVLFVFSPSDFSKSYLKVECFRIFSLQILHDEALDVHGLRESNEMDRPRPSRYCSCVAEDCDECELDSTFQRNRVVCSVCNFARVRLKRTPCSSL